MATGIYSWSQTAASNSTADTAINWAEGQLPSTVNDSARGMMSVLSKWRDDISGVQPSNVVQTSGGAANVQTLTTNGSIAALTNGWTLTFKAGFTNTGACTLNVDALGAKSIQRISGSALAGGEIIAGCVYTVTYHQPADAWVLHSSATISTLSANLSAATFSLGTATSQAADLFLEEGGVINWDNGDATITQTNNDITIAGITTFGVGTSTAVTLGTIELGAAADTTIARSSAGVATIEGAEIITGNPVTVAKGGTGQTTEAEAIGEMTQALTADATPDRTADYVPSYDASADTGKKVLISTLNPWTTVIKTADESVTSSTTFQDDNHLTFSIAANTKYTFRGMLMAKGVSNAPDIKVQWTGPAAPTLVHIGYLDAVGAGIEFLYDTQNGNSFSTAVSFASSSAVHYISFHGVIQNGANAGTVTLQWAQVTNSADAMTVYAGSYLEWMVAA